MHTSAHGDSSNKSSLHTTIARNQGRLRKRLVGWLGLVRVCGWGIGWDSGFCVVGVQYQPLLLEASAQHSKQLLKELNMWLDSLGIGGYGVRLDIGLGLVWLCLHWL